MVTGNARPVGQTDKHRCDSCGIFSLRKPAKITRAMPDNAFENAHAKLDEWTKGQGHAIESYLGGRDAMRSSLKTPCGDAQMLPTKESSPSVGNLSRKAFSSVQPLLVYVGGLSRRSQEALWRREGRMVDRLWGPESWNRALLNYAVSRSRTSPRKGQGQGRCE